METKKELIEKRDKLQKEIDNFKEELEIGKWYKNKLSNMSSLFYLTKKFESDCPFGGYGFENNRWIECNSSNYWSDVNIKPATDKEVEQALIKEAKKRGFKEGATHNCYNRSSEHKCIGYIKMGWIKHKYTLHFSDGQGIIFKNGEWAEIIEDKVPEIGSYKMGTKDGDITFGCITFTLKEAKDLLKSMNGFGINCINIEGYDINIDTIEEVINYYNSQKS